MSASTAATSITHNNDETRLPVSSSSLLPRIVAGSVGSLVTALAVTPLEVVKVRQQAAAAPPPISSTIQACQSCGTLVYNNGLMECVVPRNTLPPAAGRTNSQGTLAMLRSIFATEGLGGIYAGLKPTLVMSIPSTVLYFCAYDEIRANLLQSNYVSGDNKSSKHNNNNNNHVEWWIPLVAGSSARLLASVSTSPLELIRTQQALLASSSAQAESSQSLVQIMQSMIRSGGGIMSLYRGLAPTLWRDVPFSAIYWYSIEELKEGWKQRQGGTTTTTGQEALQAFCNGAVSGMIAAACTTPFDVLKTRQQQQQMIPLNTNISCTHGGAMAVSSSPSSQWSLARQILQDEGIRGFWRGNVTRMLKVAPACAIMISCYEVGKLVLTTK